MMSEAVITACTSALKYGAEIEQRCGVNGREFMQIMLSQLAGQGVPGAEGIYSSLHTDTVGTAPNNVGVTQDSGRGIA